VTRNELRRAIRERKKELRQQVAQLRREAKARLEADPAVRRERKRRRLRRGVGLAVLALLLLLVRCECAPPPTPEVLDGGVAVPAPKQPAPPPAPAVIKPPPLKARIKSVERATYEGQAQVPPTWLEEFRLQVAARSPRLATCFTGTDRPGALRWTAALNAESGAVSDHELESVGAASSVSTAQRECVVKALSNPTYRLNVPKGQALPDRVGMVIEF
jgi:hypothetical protein